MSSTPLHMATYGVFSYWFTKYVKCIYLKWFMMLFGIFIGGYPDYAKFFYGESYNDWSGSYRRLHEISWNNWLYFPHTGLDYITHDHVNGGWMWYAIPVEIVMWIGIFAIVYWWIVNDLMKGRIS